jgi:hypothetical protein
MVWGRSPLPLPHLYTQPAEQTATNNNNNNNNNTPTRNQQKQNQPTTRTLSRQTTKDSHDPFPHPLNTTQTKNALQPNHNTLPQRHLHNKAPPKSSRQ